MRSAKRFWPVLLAVAAVAASLSLTVAADRLEEVELEVRGMT